MNKSVFYFAYGSNMNPARMQSRIPGARLIGPGTLRGWAVRERLYADIDRSRKGRVDGVVYCITADELAVLDRYEGFPHVYASEIVNVRLAGGGSVKAITYTMTEGAKRSRGGQRYPEWYRAICSLGAQAHGIFDEFKRPLEAAETREKKTQLSVLTKHA